MPTISEIQKTTSTMGRWVFKIGEKHFYYFRKKEAQIARARAVMLATREGK